MNLSDEINWRSATVTGLWLDQKLNDIEDESAHFISQIFVLAAYTGSL